MDAFTLVAKLILDKTEFDNGIQTAENGLNSEDHDSAFSSWGQRMGRLAGQALQKTFSAAVSFAKSAIQTGMEFDTQMSYVQSIGQMTAEELEKIRTRAQELGASTKFTATQVGQAFGYMALAGWNTDEMLSGIDGVLSLAAASGEDLGTVSDIVTDALTAFGLTAEDTSHFVDVLAQASANSNTTVAQMGEAFKYLATTGGVLGYSIDDVATALGLLANNGIKGSMAGTTMRRILTSLIAPSDDAAEAMQKLGLYLFEPATDKRKPLLQVLQEMREIFKNSGFDLEGKSVEELAEEIAELDLIYADAFAEFEAGAKTITRLNTQGVLVSLNYGELVEDYQSQLRLITGFNEEFLASLSKIGGVRGISGLIALMKTTDEDFSELTSAVASSEDAAQTMAETMIDNLEGDITILNSAIDGLKILISDDFKSSFRSFVQTLTSGIGEISSAFQSGGVLGLFTNLTDWVIDGITNVLSNDSVTQEGANKFGKALGDFVGHLISKLVTAAPELMSGLFEAGLNLAGGLVEGLFSGLFGTGEGTVTGMITRTQDEQEEAIAKANANAAQASGIVSYMDSLVQKYGEAASKTTEWAEALKQLNTVMPGINDLIKAQSGDLQSTNAAIREYIENARQKAIEDAKQAALLDYTNKYVESVKNLGVAEIQRDLAREQANAAWQSLVDYIRERSGNAEFTGKGMTIGQLETTAYATANEFGDSTATIANLVKVYNEQTRSMNDFDAKIATLTEESTTLKQQMELAEKALASLTATVTAIASDGSWTSYGQWANDYYSHHHASGLNYVPYDNYPALLHRGEVVLNQDQSRDWRNGSGGFDSDKMYEIIAAAVASAVEGIQINMDGTLVGNAVTKQVSRNIYQAQYSRRYTMV